MPTAATETHILGADPAVVRRTLATGNPLPGTAGFAGSLDGTLVRDVLGRVGLFYEGPPEDRRWATCPGPLDDPTLLPAGCVIGPEQSGPSRRWSLPDRSDQDENGPHSTAAPDQRSTSDDPAATPDRALRPLRRAIETSVGELPPDGLAVAFSGGVDSAVLAALTDAPCYVASFPGGRDLTSARESADAMGLELTVVELDHDWLAATVPRVVAATGRRSPMDVAIAAPLLAVADRVAADGHDALALGQGADELFGGYEKVARAPGDDRVEATTVRGARDEVLSGIAAQLPRDHCALRAGGLAPAMPLLHDRVVRVALSLPTGLLVDRRGTRKVALRLAARAWLPHAVAFREKTAVQYGSYVARELDRLARQAGFKRRMDEHVARYVESLLEESGPSPDPPE